MESALLRVSSTALSFQGSDRLSCDSNYSAEVATAQVVWPRFKRQVENRSSIQRNSFPPHILVTPKDLQHDSAYSEPGTPRHGRAFYTRTGVCRRSSSRDSCSQATNLSCEASTDPTTEESSHDPSSRLGHLSAFRQEPVWTIDDHPASSDPDSPFKRLGVVVSDRESSWLNTPLLAWTTTNPQTADQEPVNKVPQNLERKSWFSSPSSCENSDTEAEASASFALLAPLTKTTEGEVAGRSPSGLAITIPQRSSSLAASYHKDKTAGGRKPRIKCHEDFSDAPLFERWILQELTLPTSQGKSSFTQSNQSQLDSLSTPPVSASPAHNGHKQGCRKAWGLPNDSTCSITQTLEEYAGAFPSKVLLPDTPCIQAIRFHIGNGSPIQGPFWSGASSKSESSSRKRGHQRARTSPRPKADVPFSKRAAQRFNSFGYTWDFEQKKSRWERASPERDAFSLPENPPPTCTAQLRALRKIFPGAAEFSLEALYACLVAYDFVCANVEEVDRRELASNCSASLRSVPSKAASTLGIPASTLIPTGSTESERPAANLPRLCQLRDDLATCIGELLASDTDCPVPETRGGNALLRALVEIVKQSDSQ